VIQQTYELAEYAAELDPEYEGLELGEEYEEWSDGSELADVLRDALDDTYSDASPVEMEDALGNVLEAMSPAESFNFAKALKQIERGLSDPGVSQVLRTALPIAGGAIGTVIGGPAGTALGSSLGNAAASALPGAPRARPAAPAPAPTTPPVAGGSAAAAQGLVLTQQPDVLKGLLALAMGQHGQKSVSGVPLAQLMSMLSSVFGQAAADADELMYLGREGFDETDRPLEGDVAPSDRSLYVTLMDADNEELEEAMGSS
jgi:hypothetical protein